MKFLLVSLSVGSATAFLAPSGFNGGVLSRTAAARSSLRMGFEAEAGVTAPLGFWDPLGLVADGDAAKFKRYRVAELKHGRIAMLAILGQIVPDLLRFPGYLSFSENLKFADIPNGVDALSVMPKLGIAQILIFMSVLENVILAQKKDKPAGNLGLPIWEFKYESAEEERKLENNEINNGRLAMVAAIGQIVYELGAHETPVAQLMAGHISPFYDGVGRF